MRYHLTPVRMAAIKKLLVLLYFHTFVILLLYSLLLQTINAGKCVEKREPSYTVGGNAD